MTTRRNPEMEKYVLVKPAIMEGFPDAHSVILKVTNQQFVIGRWASETKEEAEWMRDMLCVALAKIVADAHQVRVARCSSQRRNVAMTDLVIVSMHEKGFPMADMYRDAADIPADDFEQLGICPDGFFTLRRGDTLDAAVKKANKRWPFAHVIVARIVEEDGADDD